MTTNNIIRRFCVGCWRCYKRIAYRKKDVRLDYGTVFNPKTEFGKYIWIHPYTNIKDTLIGDFTYIQDHCRITKCKIGKFCSIGDDVKVLSAKHPTKDFVSTSPALYSNAKQCLKSFVNENLFEEYNSIQGYSAIIGNDVWIGSNTIILGGVIIGDGAIIAAGSIVNKNVPPYAIVGGTPAKIIRYRFSESQIDYLLNNPWWERDYAWIQENVLLFTNIKNFIKQ